MFGLLRLAKSFAKSRGKTQSAARNAVTSQPSKKAATPSVEQTPKKSAESLNDQTKHHIHQEKQRLEQAGVTSNDETSTGLKAKPTEDSTALRSREIAKEKPLPTSPPTTPRGNSPRKGRGMDL